MREAQRLVERIGHQNGSALQQGRCHDPPAAVAEDLRLKTGPLPNPRQQYLKEASGRHVVWAAVRGRAGYLPRTREKRSA